MGDPWLSVDMRLLLRLRFLFGLLAILSFLVVFEEFLNLASHISKGVPVSSLSTMVRNESRITILIGASGRI